MGCSSSKVEYIGHLEGTSHHKTKVSWKEYYQHNIDLRKNGDYEKVLCPCALNRHNLVDSPEKNPVGAHVYHIDKDGYITFGIILTCNRCNRSENKFVSTWQMVTMINCPEVKCVPFDPILKYENLDEYTSENNKFELSRSFKKYTYSGKEWTNPINIEIKNKSGNYINFIINLNKLSINFYETEDKKISIYRYKSKNKKNIRFSPTKPPNVPKENETVAATEEKKEENRTMPEDKFWGNIEYKKKYKNYKKINKKRKSDFKVVKHIYLTGEEYIEDKKNTLLEDRKKDFENRIAFMQNFSEKLYEDLYCKIIKQRRSRKCFCGNKFSDSSPGSCIIFAKNNEGECIMGVVPFCKACMEKKELPKLTIDEKEKKKKIYMNAVSIVDFYTLRSALDFPNITKIEFTTCKDYKNVTKYDDYLKIYEKKSKNEEIVTESKDEEIETIVLGNKDEEIVTESEDEEIETELWDKDLNFIEFIHSMNKIRKELYKNCGIKDEDKEFIPEVVKVLIDG